MFTSGLYVLSRLLIRLGLQASQFRLEFSQFGRLRRRFTGSFIPFEQLKQAFIDRSQLFSDGTVRVVTGLIDLRARLSQRAHQREQGG